MSEIRKIHRLVVPNKPYVRTTTDHDMGGTWSRFFLSEDSATTQPLAGCIEVGHKYEFIRVNVSFGDLKPEDALAWAELIKAAAEFANELEHE